MSDNKLSEYYVYRKIIKLLLLVCGLFPLEDAGLFYRFIPYIHLCLMFTKLVGSVGAVRVYLTNVIMLSKRLGVVMSHITISLKLVCMIIHRSDIRKLHEALDIYFNTLVKNPQFTNLLCDGVTTFRRLSWAVSLLSLFAGTVNIILPIIFIINQHKHNIQPVKYILPNASIYPWAISPNGLLYKLHYIFETVATFTLIAITSSIEPLFTLYVFQTIGRLREISYRMTNLDESHDPVSVVRHCISQYRIILKCRNMIQRVFGPIILWMIISNAIILCLGIFQLSQMKTITVEQTIFFIMYVSTKLMQTYLCGYTGSQLKDESDDYGEAVYAANWHGNKRLMSSVIIMLAQKPLIMTACHFSVISVDIFISVINTTMSYFFLLRTLQQ